MVTGRLIILKDCYYAVLNLKHPDGSRLQKRFNLGLPAKNNKRRAEDALIQLREKYTRLQRIQMNSPEMTLGEFIQKWLAEKQTHLSPTTCKNYMHIVNRHILPSFEKTPLKQVNAEAILAYYDALKSQSLSSTTIQHHHMILKQVFHNAYVNEIIAYDPMLKVNKPKREKPRICCYTSQEAGLLWSGIAGHKLEIVVKLTLFYGLRRSEVLGLRWEDIDFDTGTITINQTLVNAYVNGKYTVISKPEMKQPSSRRTLPLSEDTRRLLESELAAKRNYGNEYICTDSKGRLIKPDEVTRAFTEFLKTTGLRHIRFHDLRHTCASLLIAARTPLIEVQHWLGHSTMLTTADLYSHLEFASKIQNAETMKKFSAGQWRDTQCTMIPVPLLKLFLTAQIF